MGKTICDWTEGTPDKKGKYLVTMEDGSVDFANWTDATFYPNMGVPTWHWETEHSHGRQEVIGYADIPEGFKKLNPEL